MNNSTKILFGIMFLLFISNGCEQMGCKTRGITTSGDTITVTGFNTVTETMTIPAGTTVRFEELQVLFDNWGEDGELEFKDGGKILAQGTTQYPIIFETPGKKRGEMTGGRLVFTETASNDSIVQYCHFNPVTVDIMNSVAIQRCKFNQCALVITKNSQSLIQYNTFSFDFASVWGVLIRIGDDSSAPSPFLYYNNITGGEGGTGYGIFLGFGGSPDIKHNNITNMSMGAISYAPGTLTVTDNYIARCGKDGVDTTGEQSHNVTYVNPRTTQVTEAGCGW